jgi:hypothetical protein
VSCNFLFKVILHFPVSLSLCSCFNCPRIIHISRFMLSSFPRNDVRLYHTLRNLLWAIQLAIPHSWSRPCVHFIPQCCSSSFISIKEKRVFEFSIHFRVCKHGHFIGNRISKDGRSPPFFKFPLMRVTFSTLSFRVLAICYYYHLGGGGGLSQHVY